MDKTQSDSVVWYKLETEFFQDHVRHTKYIAKAKSRNEEVKEDWRNCGELGRGGFGVVHKQVLYRKPQVTIALLRRSIRGCTPRSTIQGSAL